MKTLLALVALSLFVAVPAPAQQFGLVSGSAQIGHTPGRIDMLHPAEKQLSLGQNISFKFTLRWPQKDHNPCGENDGCVATVGIRSIPDEYEEAWSTFSFRTDAQQVSLDLPSKADENVLPCGHHDVFVLISGRGHTLGQWYFPVAIHADNCPGR